MKRTCAVVSVNRAATVGADGLLYVLSWGDSTSGEGRLSIVNPVTREEVGSFGGFGLFPTGIAAPLASNLNFTPGQTIPNLTIVKVGVDGSVSFRNGSPSGAHLIADVAGYFRS